MAIEQVSFAVGRGGFLGGDDIGYDRVAWQQAQAWRGLGAGVAAEERYLLNLYSYTAAGLYLLAGHQPLAMKLVNAAFGALAAGLLYSLAQPIFGELAARFSGITTALFPSIVLWSAVHLKDAMVLFLLALLLWLLTQFLMRARRGLILPLLVVLTLLGSLRFYIQGMLSIIIPATVVLQGRCRFPRRWLTATLLTITCVATLWLSGGAHLIALYAPVLNYQRYGAAAGARSAYVPLPTSAPVATAAPLVPTAPADRGSQVGQVPTATVGSLPTPAPPPPLPAATTKDTLAWLPIGLAYTLAAPFPWTAHGMIERAIVPEVAVWYSAMLLAVVGIAAHRTSWRSYAHLLGYLGAMLLLFAVGQGNLGTLLRQRSMMLAPIVFIFSGAGAAWLWSTWRSRQLRQHRPETGGA